MEEALRGETDQPSLEGRVRCDICIVGGGYTGLWTALRINEQDPSADIVLLEQDVCGSGASGRNSGFVLTWWSKFPSLMNALGASEAVELCRATESEVDGFGAFCEEHGVDANYRKKGWLWTATNQAQVGAWQPTEKAIEAAGAKNPFTCLRDQEIPDRAGTSRPVAAVYERCGASIQPAALARGLRRVALDRGVRIFEHSKVSSVDSGVKTGKGEVEADTTVITTGAWLGHNNPAIAVISSDVVMTEPLDEAPLTDGLMCSDSRLLVNAFREHKGRLMFAKGGGAVAYAGRAGRLNGSSPRATVVEAEMKSFFPEFARARIVSSWSGPIDRTKSGVPFFYRDGPVIYGAGYSGVGLSQAAVGGRILASLALNLDDRWSRSGLVRGPAANFPREPIRNLGARMVRGSVARKERAEDAGKDAGPVTQMLASLAPPGFVAGAQKKTQAEPEKERTTT